VAGHPRVRLGPRLYDEHTARIEVSRHPGHGAMEAIPTDGVADRREQAGDRIKALAEIEPDHVGYNEANIWAMLGRDAKEFGADVQTNAMD
jgi:hypothetical protein